MLFPSREIVEIKETRHPTWRHHLGSRLTNRELLITWVEAFSTVRVNALSSMIILLLRNQRSKRPDGSEVTRIWVLHEFFHIHPGLLAQSTTNRRFSPRKGRFPINRGGNRMLRLKITYLDLEPTVEDRTVFVRTDDLEDGKQRL